MTSSNSQSTSTVTDRSNPLQKFLRNWFFGIPRELRDKNIEVTIEELKKQNKIKETVEKFKETVSQAEGEVNEQIKEVREKYDDLRSRITLIITLIVTIPSALAVILGPTFGNIMSSGDLGSRLERLETKVDNLYKPDRQTDSSTSQNNSCSEENFFSC